MMNIESSEYCNHDYVEVRRHDATGDLLARYCGDQLPDNLTTGEQLWVKFKSSEEVSGPGFMAQYNTRKYTRRWSRNTQYFKVAWSDDIKIFQN